MGGVMRRRAYARLDHARAGLAAAAAAARRDRLEVGTSTCSAPRVTHHKVYRYSPRHPSQSKPSFDGIL